MYREAFAEKNLGRRTVKLKSSDYKQKKCDFQAEVKMSFLKNQIILFIEG